MACYSSHCPPESHCVAPNALVPSSSSFTQKSHHQRSGFKNVFPPEISPLAHSPKCLKAHSLTFVNSNVTQCGLSFKSATCPSVPKSQTSLPCSSLPLATL